MNIYIYIMCIYIYIYCVYVYVYIMYIYIYIHVYTAIMYTVYIECYCSIDMYWYLLLLL